MESQRRALVFVLIVCSAAVSSSGHRILRDTESVGVRNGMGDDGAFTAGHLPSKVGMLGSGFGIGFGDASGSNRGSGVGVGEGDGLVSGRRGGDGVGVGIGKASGSGDGVGIGLGHGSDTGGRPATSPSGEGCGKEHKEAGFHLTLPALGIDLTVPIGEMNLKQDGNRGNGWKVRTAEKEKQDGNGGPKQDGNGGGDWKVRTAEKEKQDGIGGPKQDGNGGGDRKVRTAEKEKQDDNGGRDWKVRAAEKEKQDGNGGPKQDGNGDGGWKASTAGEPIKPLAKKPMESMPAVTWKTSTADSPRPLAPLEESDESGN